ncbi:related to Pre-mRNA-splicing factor PRP9 [Zygosaccharomyces bailii]|nr:related to Pre-mRNA-splicing factor PRP9 [Zygosaccharomyces bailii]
MATLEKRRELLEDLEIIEDAISHRFARNPELYYSNVIKEAFLDATMQLPSTSNMAANRIYKNKKAKRSRKQIVTQQHEIDLFLSQMLAKQKELNSLKGPVNTEDYEDNENNFNHLKEKLAEINSKYETAGDLQLDVNEKIAQYRMFSASGESNTILSEKARDLDVNQLFTREEQYGEFMDVEKFHYQWLNVIRNADCSLLGFFNILEKFLSNSDYLLTPPMDRRNQKYGQFLIQMSCYFEQFFNKVYILVNSELLRRKLETDFEEYMCTPIVHVQNGCYCVVCGKWFKVMTVFQSHLLGKHHKKNQARRYSTLIAEYKLHRYLNLLQKELRNTKEFIERKLAFTAEERMEEMSRISLAYEGPDYAIDERENEDKKSKNVVSERSNGELELPLGPDGLPMPHWLYKLQGLDVLYTCEICGDQSYKGRRMFEKHFNEPTHLFHLKCLGIEPSDAFKFITSIQEVQDLWKRISGSRKESSREIEVEDDDGNVMTQQVYEELKKQGLV